MDGNDNVFCTRCGAKMSSDAVFCPECGAQMAVIPQQTTEQYFREHPERKKQTNMMLWTKILLFVYGGVALLTGIMVFTMGEWSLNVLESTDPGYMDSMLKSLGLTRDQYLTVCNVMGLTNMVSGALALVSGLMCVRRRYNKAAIILCIIASIICIVPLFSLPSNALASNILSTAIGVAVGFVVAYLIYRVRGEFED